LLLLTDVVTLPKVFIVLFSAEVAPITDPVTCHQRQPTSEATSTAPQVKLVHALICDDNELLADKIPTNSFAVGIFIYSFVSPSGSVLNPAGGHFGEGEGVNLATFFFAGAFFLAGFFFAGAFFAGALALTLALGVGVAFFVAVAFGVGVGLFVAASAGVTVMVRMRARLSANFLDLIISVDPI
jgi:hypothetical protein